MEQVDGGGTDGDEGDVHPRADLKGVHAVLWAVLHLSVKFKLDAESTEFETYRVSPEKSTFRNFRFWTVRNIMEHLDQRDC